VSKVDKRIIKAFYRRVATSFKVLHSKSYGNITTGTRLMGEPDLKKKLSYRRDRVMLPVIEYLTKALGVIGMTILRRA